MSKLPLKRYTADLNESLPIIAIDLGYSAKLPSCGWVNSGDAVAQSLDFGQAIEATRDLLLAKGPHMLILEAVLSTYHGANGNPDIRGDFEKGRGWYYGPGVTTYAAAVRFLTVLHRELPSGIGPLPLVEGFLSFKKARSTHSDDAIRLISEFATAERFEPRPGSEAIHSEINGVPKIFRYNKP
jgi:hypothetical protein